MNDKKKEQLKGNLVEMGLMEQKEALLECVQANYRKRELGVFWKWKQGWIYFTEKQMIYPLGLLEEAIVIPYSSIRRIEKFSASLIPMGMAITYDAPKTGDETEAKFTISKRDKWIAFLSEKAGLSVG